MTKHFRTFVATRRRGMGVIAVLAVFAVTVAMSALWTKGALAQHRHQLLSELRVQTQWLAEAGVRRGAARWLAAADYAGEAWRIPGAEFDRPSDAAVEIRIESVDATDGEVRIVAVASYPREKPRVKVTKAVRLTRPSGEPSQ